MRDLQGDDKGSTLPSRDQRPILPGRQPMPGTPTMPPIMYPPGSAFNPIGTPPSYSMPSQPGGYMPMPGGGMTPVPPGREPSVPYYRGGGTTEPDIDFEIEPGPPVMTDTDYLQGYLRTLIGRYIKVEFLIGTNMLMDREGTLMEVGIDHIVLREPQTDDLLVCDLYSIKFVEVFL